MYLILDKNTREVLERNDSPFGNDPALQPPDPLIQLTEVRDNTVPPFDKRIQKLDWQFTDDDAAFTRNWGYVVVPLSQQELDDIAERQQVKTVIQDLRNSTGSNAQRITRCERVLVYLLRQLERSAD